MCDLEEYSKLIECKILQFSFQKSRIRSEYNILNTVYCFCQSLFLVSLYLSPNFNDLCAKVIISKNEKKVLLIYYYVLLEIRLHQSFVQKYCKLESHAVSVTCIKGNFQK